MMYRILLLVTCCFLWTVAPAQVRPTEGDILNYRMVGFTVPQAKKAASYLFEVSEYSFKDQKETFSNTISQVSDSNRAIIMLPAFGKDYAWCVKYLNRRGKVTGSTQYYHFSVGTSKYVDTAQYRLEIIDSAKDHHDLFILTDYIPVIYNLKGEPIWYMPDVVKVPDIGLQLRDLKPHRSSFTAIADHEAIEFDFKGKLLWKAPNDGRVSGDSTEHYHHEMIKLPNGNNMIASHQTEIRKVPEGIKIDTARFNDARTDTIVEKHIAYIRRKDGFYKRCLLGNLIEFNPKTNEVVWVWRSLDHFDDADFFIPFVTGLLQDMHMNAFYFDTLESAIYISFRNNSEIVKISYPSGQILKRYGSIWSDTGKTSSRLFYGQHCIQKTNDNQLLVFNNNANEKKFRRDSTAAELLSFATMFRENNTQTGLEETWRFSCAIDSITETGSPVGGSVIPLPDSCFLVCVGGAGRVFIVNRNKEIIWNAVTKTRDQEGNWFVTAQYRAYYLSKENMLNYILN